LSECWKTRGTLTVIVRPNDRLRWRRIAAEEADGLAVGRQLPLLAGGTLPTLPNRVIQSQSGFSVLGNLVIDFCPVFCLTLLPGPACLLNSSRISMQIVRLVSGVGSDLWVGMGKSIYVSHNVPAKSLAQ